MARLAYSGLNTSFARPSHSSADSEHKAPDDDAESVLDDNILDQPNSGMSSNDLSHQRESLTNSSPAFSPRDSRWSEFAFPADSSVQVHPVSNAAPLFYDQGNGAFIDQDATTGTMYGNQVSAWQPQGEQGACISSTTYECFPSGQDVKNLVPLYNHEPLNQLHASMYGGLPVGPGTTFQQGNALPTSPKSGQDWSSISSAEQMDSRPVPKAEPLSSPLYNLNPPLMRRDGIRKKNARFEIPAERTLRTIDHLINQTNDETEIKELKQQKRLLRNRQAALDSRQRKKQHTERLEEEKKHTSNLISELEEALGELKVREAGWTREKEEMMMFHHRQKQYIDELLAEKEEMVRRHTVETTELRRKNAILADQAQKMDAVAMSAVPSSNGYSADFSEFDHLAIDNCSWENFSTANGFAMEPEQKEEMSLVNPSNLDKYKSKHDERATCSGLLLMLLLCGAWVTSNSASTKQSAIPEMPEDVRTASAAVLETIYNDAGLQLPTSLSGRKQDADTRRASTSRHPSFKTTVNANDFSGISTSPLASLHHQLVTPTDQQRRDQAFSLSVNQYNSITSDDDATTPNEVQTARRRNLGAALATMRSTKQAKEGSAAEVYTRSLLWDELPVEVIHEFAQMVANGRDNKAEPPT
ncbi:MAG: hypothetical protein LQ351_004385 [Letrouitia transgressa]|nr:MAG: hypothetical protein LQ351_004385 [Letrouitia transgressa]